LTTNKININCYKRRCHSEVVHCMIRGCHLDWSIPLIRYRDCRLVWSIPLNI
jgi:hypothetical protein